jgi:hypothetical protein
MRCISTVLLGLAACARPGSSADPRTPETAPVPIEPEAKPDAPDMDVDAIAKSAQLDIPASAPTGPAVRLPAFQRKVGDSRRVHYATGGTANTEHDHYEATLTVKAMTGPVVTEMDYDVFYGSMSAFAGRSSLDGGYTVRTTAGKDGPTFAYYNRAGDKLDGIAAEELGALAGPFVGRVHPVHALLPTLSLRVGEVVKLDDAHKKLLVGEDVPADVYVLRAPDRKGRFVAELRISLTTKDDTRRSRGIYELDPKSGELLRSVEISEQPYSKSDVTRFVTINDFEPAK